MVYNGKATGGLVQQQFGKMAGSVLNSTAVLRFDFCAKLNICASIAPPSQSPKPLSVILKKIMYEIEDIDIIFFPFFNSKFFAVKTAW